MPASSYAGKRWNARTAPAGEGTRENYDELFDVSCPRCDKMLLIVSNPTIEQVKAAAATGNPEAVAEMPRIEQFEAFQRKFEAEKLRSSEQLPDLDGDRLEFVWDEEIHAGDDRRTVIRIEDKIIWSEPELWEGAERFDEVKSLLKQRYGPRFRSLTPTDASELYLYGDHGRRVSIN